MSKFIITTKLLLICQISYAGINFGVFGGSGYDWSEGIKTKKQLTEYIWYLQENNIYNIISDATFERLQKLGEEFQISIPPKEKTGTRKVNFPEFIDIEDAREFGKFIWHDKIILKQLRHLIFTLEEQFINYVEDAPADYPYINHARKLAKKINLYRLALKTAEFEWEEVNLKYGYIKPISGGSGIYDISNEYLKNNITTREKASHYLDKIISEGILNKYNRDQTLKFKRHLIKLKIYPGALQENPNKDDYPWHAPKNLRKEAYFFFNFDIPNSEEEELILLNSENFHKKKKEIARLYHPDLQENKSEKEKNKAKYWWSIYSALIKLTEKRKKTLENKQFLTTHDILEPRTPNEMEIQTIKIRKERLPENVGATIYAGSIFIRK